MRKISYFIMILITSISFNLVGCNEEETVDNPEYNISFTYNGTIDGVEFTNHTVKFTKGDTVSAEGNPMGSYYDSGNRAQIVAFPTQHDCTAGWNVQYVAVYLDFVGGDADIGYSEEIDSSIRNFWQNNNITFKISNNGDVGEKIIGTFSGDISDGDSIGIISEGKFCVLRTEDKSYWLD